MSDINAKEFIRELIEELAELQYKYDELMTDYMDVCDQLESIRSDDDED